jgi:hypothetical protein
VSETAGESLRELWSLLGSGTGLGGGQNQQESFRLGSYAERLVELRGPDFTVLPSRRGVARWAMVTRCTPVTEPKGQLTTDQWEQDAWSSLQRGASQGARPLTPNARARTPGQAGGQHEPTVSAHAVRAAPIEQP